MGALTWVAAALLALLAARRIAWGLRRHLAAEMLVTIAAGFGCGLAATALDFGGWGSADWRAAAFALFGALGALGLMRATGAQPSPPSR